MKQVQDVVERLWDFIDKLDINTFWKFLADNIVGSVVAFSLLFWVPFSILVHCVVSGICDRICGGAGGFGSPLKSEFCRTSLVSGPETR